MQKVLLLCEPIASMGELTVSASEKSECAFPLDGGIRLACGRQKVGGDFHPLNWQRPSATHKPAEPMQETRWVADQGDAGGLVNCTS